MNDMFVYGTLVDPTIQQQVLGRTLHTFAAELSGFEVKRGRWPYVVPSATGGVSGTVLTDLSTADLSNLDAYERITSTPDLNESEREIYKREAIQVRKQDGSPLTCWVYLPRLEKWKPHWLASADGAGS